MTEWSAQCPSLLSFAYQRANVDTIVERMTIRGVKPLLIGDSGAFTMKTQGKAIKINEYAAWCHRYAHHLAHVVNLDVIGEHEASWRNWLALNEMGVHSIPVVHAGAPWFALDRYLEAGCPYIGLGGLVGAAGALERWMTEAFTRTEGTAVLHGFGMTKWPIITEFPFYSVDSSSWSSGFRYGMIHLWDEDRARFVILELFSDKVYEHGDLVRAHGLEPKQLGDRAEYHTTYACMAAVTAWRRAALWLRRRHAPVPLDGFPDGPHLHLAEASSTFIGVLARTCARVAREEEAA